MSAANRLGAALAKHIADVKGDSASAFVRLDAIPENVAAAMAAAWPEDSVALAVASSDPGRFGSNALKGAGTGLRNANPDGVCLVVCEGQRLDDEQSLRSFENIAPADLLAGSE